MQSAHVHNSGSLPNALQKPLGPGPLQGFVSPPAPVTVEAEVGVVVLSSEQPAKPANRRDKEAAKISIQWRMRGPGSGHSVPASTAQSGRKDAEQGSHVGAAVLTAPSCDI